MRILVCNRPGGAFGFITDGWVNALRDKGHIVQRYDDNINSWHTFKPDVYIGCSGHRQRIPNKHNSKIAIHVNPYGPVNIEGINESKDSIKWVMDQNPDVVFGYGTEEDRLLWSYWTDRHKIPWIPMPTAGDKTIYKSSKESNKVYDFVYLGGRWKYKALTIDEYLMPLFQHSKSYKLHGWGEWPGVSYSGILADDEVNHFLGSGKVGPCVSERHTHNYGIDIPERAFKLALCNTLVIHDPVVQIRSLIPSALIATTPEQYRELCFYYAEPANDQERIEISKKQREEVLNSQTYHHRMHALLKALDFNIEADKMIA